MKSSVALILCSFVLGSASEPVAAGAQSARLIAASDQKTTGNANGHAVLKKAITLNLNRVKLGDALVEISKLSGVQIIYSKEVVPVAQLISLKVIGEPLGE